MIVVALNVRHGGGQRRSRILDFIAQQEPDVVVLPEWRATWPADEFGRWASSRGMAWSAVSKNAKANGVLVASRYPIQQEKDVTPDTPPPGAAFRLDFATWTLVACYFPGIFGARKPEHKAAYFDVCAQIAAECDGRPLLIVGDLNTGNQDLDRTPNGEVFACADRFDALTKNSNLRDLWRRTNGPRTQEWTWQNSKSSYRLDHALGNTSFVDAFNPICRYDEKPRSLGLSDHSAVILR